LSIRPEGSGVAFSGSIENREQSLAIKQSLQQTDESVNQIRRTSDSELLEPLNTQSLRKRESISKEQTMSTNESEETTAEPNTEEETVSKPIVTRRSYKYDDPPLVFKDVDVSDV
jgi:hypothetical protein